MNIIRTNLCVYALCKRWVNCGWATKLFHTQPKGLLALLGVERSVLLRGTHVQRITSYAHRLSLRHKRKCVVWMVKTVRNYLHALDVICSGVGSYPFARPPLCHSECVCVCVCHPPAGYQQRLCAIVCVCVAERELGSAERLKPSPHPSTASPLRR